MAHRVASSAADSADCTRRALKRRSTSRSPQLHLFQPLLYGGHGRALAGQHRGAVAFGVARQKNARAAGRSATSTSSGGKYCWPTARSTHADRGRRLDVQLLRPRRLAEGGARAETLEDATDIRRRMLTAFEDAERMDDPARIARRSPS